MKSVLIFIIYFLFSIFCLGQTKEIVYSNPKDTMSNFYIAFKPTGQINGLLLLLTSFGEMPQVASNETDIHKVANNKGIVTVYASLQMGTMTFFIDSNSQSTLDKLIPDFKRNIIQKTNLFI